MYLWLHSHFLSLPHVPIGLRFVGQVCLKYTVCTYVCLNSSSDFVITQLYKCLQVPMVAQDQGMFICSTEW